MLKRLLTGMATRLMAPEANESSQGDGGGNTLPDDHTVADSGGPDPRIGARMYCYTKQELNFAGDLALPKGTLVFVESIDPESGCAEVTWEPDHRARVWPTDLDPRDLQPRDTVSVGNVGDARQIDETAEALIAEAEKARAEFPAQTVTIRARGNSQQLGLVVQRYAGGYTVEELQQRHAREITLNAGDQLLVVPMHGRDLDQFKEMAKAATEAAASSNQPSAGD